MPQFDPIRSRFKGLDLDGVEVEAEVESDAKGRARVRSIAIGTGDSRVTIDQDEVAALGLFNSEDEAFGAAFGLGHDLAGQVRSPSRVHLPKQH